MERRELGVTTKADLHQLVDSLPDRELIAAQRFLEFLRSSEAEDPVIRAFLDAPYDDEPLTQEEEAAVEEARAEIARGEAQTWESVRAELFQQN